MNRIHVGLFVFFVLLCFVTPAGAQASEPRPVGEVVAELDAALAAVWKDAGVKPARVAKASELFRRSSLDLAGVVPDAETTAAVASKKKKKKTQRHTRLVQALLRSRNYASFMATRWANLLVGRQYLMRQGGTTQPLVRWLQQQFAANTRWDVVARQLLTAEGRPDENGAAQYLIRWDRKPEEMAGNAMRVFQGQQVQCAQCHDHPYKETWTQKSFWALAAFFARVGQRNQNQIIEIFEQERGEVHIPGPPGARGPQVAPKFITGESIDPGEGDYRRTELARILTSANNPWFARATVNRVWSFFFGEGFTDPDDMDKPSMPSVLAVLEDDFKASGYDMRRLCEIIVSSRAYCLTSTGPKKTKAEQVEVFARAPLRPLTAEQLWWSFLRATGLRATVENAAMKNGNPDAAQQQLNNLRRRFFRTFGTEDGGAADEQSLTQAFLLLNGPFTNDALRADRSPLVQRLLKQTPERRINALFLRVLGRPATRGERKALRSGASSSQEQAYHLQDVFWALLNSSEFLYNH